MLDFMLDSESRTIFFIYDSKVIAMINSRLTAVASQAAQANLASVMEGVSLVWHLEREGSERNWCETMKIWDNYRIY